MDDETTNEGIHKNVEKVTIRFYSTREAAALSASNLEAHGIPSWISADDCAGMYPTLSIAGGVRLKVRVSDAESAIALLMTEVTPAELARIEKEAVSTTPSKEFPASRIAIGQILFGVVIGIITGLLFQSNREMGTKTYTYYSTNGRKVRTVFYRDGHAKKMIRDRNFDGKADEWVYYKNGMVTSVEYDNNFDGKRDTFITYSNDVPLTFKKDSDFNGIPDMFGSYQDGIIKEVDYKPNGLPFTRTREIFKDGILSVVWRGGDKDGVFRERQDYDAFINPVQTNRAKPFHLITPGLK